MIISLYNLLSKICSAYMMNFQTWMNFYRWIKRKKRKSKYSIELELIINLIAAILSKRLHVYCQRGYSLGDKLHRTICAAKYAQNILWWGGWPTIREMYSWFLSNRYEYVIVLTIFVLIMNQMEFHSVNYNQKEQLPAP